MAAISSIAQLRQLLAERHQGARWGSAAAPTLTAPRLAWATGWSPLDSLLNGGLPRRGITEIVSPHPGGGSALIMRRLLHQASRQRQWVGLIDGTDCFDPESVGGESLERLLWVRCRDAAQALRAMDLMLRDGNLPLLLLDLQLNPTPQLRRIPTSVWFRFQRLLESNATALLVLSPCAMVSRPRARLVVHGQFPLSALDQTEDTLLDAVRLEAVRAPNGNAQQLEPKQEPVG